MCVYIHIYERVHQQMRSSVLRLNCIQWHYPSMYKKTFKNTSKYIPAFSAFFSIRLLSSYTSNRTKYWRKYGTAFGGNEKQKTSFYACANRFNFSRIVTFTLSSNNNTPLTLQIIIKCFSFVIFSTS